MTATQNHQNEVMEQAPQHQQQNGASNDMYNSMGYQGQGNQMGMMEPMAANDALGGFTSF